MKTLLISLTLLFFPQNLPTYGDINGLRGLSKVYVASDNEDSRKRIVKILDKKLQVVDSPNNAEFFVEFAELSREAVSTAVRKNDRQERSQMRVYILDLNKQKIIVWADTRSRETEHYLGMKMYDSGRNESELTKKFLKALKKATEH